MKEGEAAVRITATMVAGLLACSPALATTSTSTNATSFLSQQSDPFRAEAQSNGTHHAGSAEANALANHGVLKVDSESSMSFYTGDNNSNSVYSSHATANSRFSDFIVFGGGPANTVGWVTFGVDVTGTQLASAIGGLEAYTHGVANWELRVNLNGQTSVIYRNLRRTADGSFSDVSGGYAGASPFDTHWFTAPMLFGSVSSIDVQLNAASNATINAAAVDGAAFGLIDLGHSAHWAGISGVTLADGTPVAFTATADSGTDYIPSMVPVPVPEPGTWVLMLAGMVFVCRRVPRHALRPQASAR
jgi:hypothetical protein